MWITGQVVDDRGRALRDVAIQASGPPAAERRTGVTNAQGQYVLQDLHPGVYTITFARPGFSTLKRKTEALKTFVAIVDAQLHAL